MTTAEHIAKLRKEIDETHKHGLKLDAEIKRERAKHTVAGNTKARFLTMWLRGLEQLNRRREAEIAKLEKEKPKPPQRFTMYDAVEVSNIPSSAGAVAGYVGGKWPTYAELVKRFPHAAKLSIAINASEDAECLDVENGDATPADAPAWVRKQHARGIKRPVIYANTSTMPSVLQAILKNNIKRSEVRVWSAHYSYQEHVEPGSDATQWTDKALGKDLDQSCCEPGFLT
jgi:hypothetical protein